MPDNNEPLQRGKGVLKTQRNTKTMGARVLRAFKKFARTLPRSQRTAPKVSIYFEHGQWWITDVDNTGAQWSVCDAEGTEAAGVFDGFCFEQVSRGEEE